MWCVGSVWCVSSVWCVGSVCLSISLPTTVDDLSRNNGVDRPYFMTKSLQRLMGVSNKVKPGDVQLDDLENNDGGKPA